MPAAISIVYDNASGVFYSGHPVSGVVRIRLTEQMNMRQVKVLFSGKASVLVEFRFSRDRKRNFMESETVTIRSKHIPRV